MDTPYVTGLDETKFVLAHKVRPPKFSQHARDVCLKYPKVSPWALIFGVSCWVFWDWLNKSILELQFIWPLDSAIMIFKVVHEFVQSNLCANAHTDRKARDWKLIGWRMPSNGWLKLNTNRAAKGNQGLAGAGGLLRDDNGKWLGGFVHNIGIATSVLAELWVVKRGIKVSWEIGARMLVFETESELVANLLRSSSEQVDRNAAIVSDIRSLLNRNWSIMIEHTYRECNICVYWLANHALTLPLRVRRLVSFPIGLDHLIFHDIIRGHHVSSL
ncbi:hypothetical protein CRG98_030411 [Punica granatum]|uniref:RNase H type-1 domain-containing protein n=1 Tax=Punica granatum TaxID=22663 RepID=A0A2I0IZL7_PUNGR|nr:hypothetical protein CRG98_030411 [Punica granatum]